MASSDDKPETVTYTDDKGNEKTMERSPESGVLEGTVEERPGGFAVKHPDGSESSYTVHGPEPVPGSVDEIDAHKRPKDEAEAKKPTTTIAPPKSSAS